MTNNEAMTMMLKLTEENTRLKCAIDLLDKLYRDDMEAGHSGVLGKDEIENVLALAKPAKELNVIYWDNAKDEVAYEQKSKD